MAGNSVRVSTALVSDTAQAIKRDNDKLRSTLEEGRSTINQLSEIWEGEASQLTREAFEDFAKKYFDNYEQAIDQYVKFLHRNVEQGYTEVESANAKLADMFK